MAKCVRSTHANLCDGGAGSDLFVLPHRSTLQCIRTMTCEYALCSFFVPGDRQVVIGTKVNRDVFLDLGVFSIQRP